MTRQEAAEKVAKLHRLASGSSCAHEAASARRQAEKITREHGLSQEDVSAGERAAAFDDLIGQLESYVSSHPSVPAGLFDQVAVVRDVLAKIKNMTDVEKSRRLGQVTTIVGFASLLTGDTPVVRDLKDLVERAVKKHSNGERTSR